MITDSSKYRFLIFDLDDTIFDYQTTEIYALQVACRAHNISFEYNKIYPLYKDANKIIKRQNLKLISDKDFNYFRMQRASLFLKSIGYNHINTKEFVNAQLKYSINGILINGVYETMKDIDKDIIKVVATNGSNYPRKNKFENSIISSLVNDFYSSEDLGVQKPDPLFFYSIIEKYDGISISDVLVIGDNPETDIQGSLNANISCCLFNYRNLDLSKLPSQVKVIESFTEILNIIK